MRVLVYGLARSGRAAAARLESRGDEVVEVDRSLGNEDDLGLLDGVELLVKSPGVPGEQPLVEEARRRGIPVWSEVELGWSLLAPAGTRFVGVTGTNGKTTTAELLGAIFRAAGRDVAVAGNVGTPLSSVDGGGLGRVRGLVVPARGRPRASPATSRCCSTSSPTTSTGTAPSRPTARRSCGSSSAPASRSSRPARASTGIEFSADDPLPAEPLLRGAHNRENAAAATAAARAAGIGDDAIAEALRTFPGVPHRLEPVGEVDGVRYVNDSKATNVAAALRALAAYADEPVHLILGGSLKGESFAPLAAAIGPNVLSIHLIGEAAERARGRDSAGRGHRDLRLERAVMHAWELAEPGSVVLLSPACASYDQYENFERRGEHFKLLVSALQDV